MRRRTAGVLQLALVGLLLSGVGMAATGGWAWFKSKRVTTAERNAHWQGVVDVLQRDHRKAVEDEAAKVRAIEEQWRIQRREADHAQERERAATRTALAAAYADAGRLRDQLAAAAAGGVTEAEDTVTACRGRAAAFGRVLDEALRAHAQCSADAEDLAAGVRALRAAWPVEAAASAP